MGNGTYAGLYSNVDLMTYYQSLIIRASTAFVIVIGCSCLAQTVSAGYYHRLRERL